MKNLKNIIPILVISALFGLLIWNIVKNWQQIITANWHLSYPNLFLLIIFSVAIYPINILSWHILTKALNLNLSIATNAKIWMYSNLSRFLPGGIWQYPSRVYLISKQNISKSVAATAIILETFFILLTGSISVLLLIFFGELHFSNEIKIIFFTIFLVSMLAIIFSKSLVNKLVFFLSKILKKPSLSSVFIPMKLMPQVTLIFFLQFVTNGLVLYILSGSVVDLKLSQVPLFVGIFALSWLLGYVSLVAPSGLGVQEASIATLLSLMMPLPIASVVAILFRFILLISEASVLFLVFIFAKRFDSHINVKKSKQKT